MQLLRIPSMAKTIADLTALSNDVQAVQALQAQVRRPMKDLLNELVVIVGDFAKVGSDEWRWLTRSRFSELMNTGSIGYGNYEFWVSAQGKFVLETDDTYGGRGQMALTIAEVADLKTVLEKEYSDSK
jgi:hypothetical protein